MGAQRREGLDRPRIKLIAIITALSRAPKQTTSPLRIEKEKNGADCIVLYRIHSLVTMPVRLGLGNKGSWEDVCYLDMK